MGRSLPEEQLKQAVGRKAENSSGAYLGEIVEVTGNASGEGIDYVILKNDEFFGGEERYFAIPASSTFIAAIEDELVFNLEKNDLKLAKGVPAAECPKPIKKFGETVYEIYNYQV